MHLVALGFGYGSGIVALSQNLFNPSTFQNLCSFGVAPPGCNYNPNVDSCTRGHDVKHYTLLLFVIPTLIVVGTIVVTLATVICLIQMQLHRNKVYDFHRKHRYSSTNVSISAGSNQEILSSALYDSKSCLNVTAQTSKKSLQQQLSLSRLPSSVDAAVDAASNAPTTSNISSLTSSRGGGSRHSRQASRESSVSSSREGMLNQAIIQCFAYGIANLCCLIWTVAVRILMILDREKDLMTKYYWVCRNCFLCINIKMRVTLLRSTKTNAS
jgi:hypothetical protein